jgi:hypothetical protein
MCCIEIISCRLNYFLRSGTHPVVEYRQDPQGQVVVSKLDKRALTEMASETDGRYFRATTSENELDQIEDDVAHIYSRTRATRVDV